MSWLLSLKSCGNNTFRWCQHVRAGGGGIYTHVAAVLDAPYDASRVLDKANLVSQTVGKHLAGRLVVVSGRRGGAHVEDLDDGAAGGRLRRLHVEIGVGAHLDENHVGLGLDHHDIPGRVDARVHACDDGLLVADGAGDRVVGPRPDGSLAARVQCRAIGREGQAVVQLHVADERAGAVDAPVVAERVHRDALAGLRDQHVSVDVPRHRPDAPQPARDLHHRPPRRNRPREPQAGNPSAARRQR